MICDVRKTGQPCCPKTSPIPLFCFDEERLGARQKVDMQTLLRRSKAPDSHEVGNITLPERPTPRQSALAAWTSTFIPVTDREYEHVAHDGLW
jgi:hypothetical protein